MTKEKRMFAGASAVADGVETRFLAGDRMYGGRMAVSVPANDALDDVLTPAEAVLSELDMIGLDPARLTDYLNRPEVWTLMGDDEEYDVTVLAAMSWLESYNEAATAPVIERTPAQVPEGPWEERVEVACDACSKTRHPSTTCCKLSLLPTRCDASQAPSFTLAAAWAVGCWMGRVDRSRT